MVWLLKFFTAMLASILCTTCLEKITGILVFSSFLDLWDRQYSLTNQKPKKICAIIKILRISCGIAKSLCVFLYFALFLQFHLLKLQVWFVFTIVMRKV
jgi:hypothetical protein